MACTHHHAGLNHNPGDTPIECSPNCKGRVTYCGPDPDDPFAYPRLCEHEDGPAAAGAPLTVPLDSVIRLLGVPQEWGPWEDLAAGAIDKVRIRLVSDRFLDKNPFAASNIPCNPHAVNSIHLQETVQVRIGFSASVSGKLKGWIETRLGLELGKTKTVTVNRIINGEKCRSIDLKVYKRFKLWEVQYAGQGEPITLAQVLEPFGLYVLPVYVPPTCCAVRSGSLIEKAMGMLGEADGSGKHALAGAADAFVVARACMIEPRDHRWAFDSFAEALAKLEESGTRTPVAYETVAETVALVEELTTQTTKALLSSWAETGDVEAFRMAGALEGLQLLNEDLATARSLGARDPAAAVRAYGRAHQRAMAMRSQAQSAFVFLDMGGIPTGREAG